VRAGVSTLSSRERGSHPGSIAVCTTPHENGEIEMPNRNEYGQQYGRHEDDRWRGTGGYRDDDRFGERHGEESRYGARDYDRDYGAVRGRDDDRHERSYGQPGQRDIGRSMQRDYSSGDEYRSSDPGQGYGWQGGYGNQGQSGYGGQYRSLSGREYWQHRDRDDRNQGQYGHSSQGSQYGQGSQYYGGQAAWDGSQYGGQAAWDRSYAQGGYGQGGVGPRGQYSSSDRYGSSSGYGQSGYSGQSSYGQSYGQYDRGSMGSQDYRSRDYLDRDRDIGRMGDDNDKGLLQRAGEWIERKIGKAPKNYSRSDERIREDVCDRLMQRWEVDASDVDVQVKDGEVILSGIVSERRAKRVIEDIAEDVLGVKDVTNHIKVKHDRDNRMSGSDDGSKMTGTTTGTTASTTTRPRASS
jgi:hypothetical protein